MVVTDPRRVVRSPGRLSFGVAFGVVLLVVATLAAMESLYLQVGLGLVAAILLSLGMYGLDQRAPQHVALGSLSVMGGLVTFSGSIAATIQVTSAREPGYGYAMSVLEMLFYGAPILVVLALAAGLVLFSLAVVRPVSLDYLQGVLARTINLTAAIVVLAVVFFAIHVDVVSTVVRTAVVGWEIFLQIVTANPVIAFWASIVEVCIVLLTLPSLILRLPDRLVPPAFKSKVVSLREMLNGAIAVVLLLGVFASPFLVIAFNDATLQPELQAAMGQLETMLVDNGIHSILELPAFHGVLVGLVCLTILVMLGRFAYRRLQFVHPRLAAQWIAPHVGPLAIGGLIVVLAKPIGSVFGTLPPGLERQAASAVETFGPETFLLGLVALTAMVGVGLWIAITIPLLLGHVSSHDPALSMATGFVSVGVLGTTMLSTPPLVAFAGIAGVLFAWDVAANASSLGYVVDRDARTGRGEFVHIGGSLVVAMLAVGAGVVALRVPRWIQFSPPPGVATLGLPITVMATAIVLWLLGR